MSHCAVKNGADLKVAGLRHNPYDRRHASLHVSGSAWHLTDEGSTNGIAIGTQRVSGTIRVWPGQEIRMGSAVLRLRRLTSAPSAALGLIENSRPGDARGRPRSQAATKNAQA